jgi:CO/xanthine dehydrogenase Mo-binding subunit
MTDAAGATMGPSYERLLRGEGTFASDVHLQGLAHAAVLRSPYAHARIARIDCSAARAAPGVLAAVTFEDLAERAKPIPQLMPFRGLRSRTPYALAHEAVRYAGEPVAVVVADDRYRAEDALERITVDYEPQEAVVDPEAALAGGPRVHDDLPDNVAGTFGQELGDVERALAGAHVVLTERLTIGRASAQPVETRALTARYRPDHPEALTVWCSTQSPHTVRRILAELLDLPPERVRVIAPAIGGGFGVKNRFYPEDALVPLMAMRLGRPVKWVEDRRESFVATYHGRGQVHDVTLGLAADGRIVALRDRFIQDQGAYTPLGVVVPYITSVSVVGPYRVPQYKVECTLAFTNTTPTAPYRGAGKPEATFVMERMLDLGAERLGIDPVEIRRRNLLRAGDFPYDTGLIDHDETHVVYDSGDYEACLDRALELVDYAGFPELRARARAQGRHIGIGVACYVEMTGRGPFEGARVRVEPTGKVVLSCGVSSQGQGHETTLAHICAQHLGVRVEDVSVVNGDTATIPRSIGTYAARVTVMAGNAVALAATTLREQALSAAARMLDVPPDRLELVEGEIWAPGVGRHLSLGDVARRLGAVPPSDPPTASPGLEATEFFSSDRPAFADGTYAVVVEVWPETGYVKVVRHAIVHDCGVAVNPRLVEGQLRGGVAQGIGAALLEEVHYDPAGLPSSRWDGDYLLPTANDVPPLLIGRVETRSPFNPLGVKGVGEAGTIPVPAAIAAAIEDALDHSVRLRRVPVHPPDLADLVAARAPLPPGGSIRWRGERGPADHDRPPDR